MAKYKLKKRLKRYNTPVPSKEDFELRDRIIKEVSEQYKLYEKTFEEFLKEQYRPIMEKILEPKPRLLPTDKESK